jgi:hypothetical protein
MVAQDSRLTERETAVTCPVPPYVKPLSVVLGLLRLVLFLLIVEFEVNAGQIKYGSEVIRSAKAEEVTDRRVSLRPPKRVPSHR